MAWFPPGVDPVEHSALVPGIPDWMADPLQKWVVSRLYDSQANAWRTGLIQEWDTAMRNSPADLDRFKKVRGGTFWSTMPFERAVIFLDFLVHRNAQTNAEAANARLETILHDAGSEWRVGSRHGNAGLEKRVPQGVVDAAESTMRTAGTAGALLSEAWHAAFGRDPDPEEAYEKAIKAVEEAGAGKVAPKNDKSTLGTMARDMEAQGDWALPLGDDEKHPARDVAYKMVRSLWSGQESRHGGNGYRKPAPDEAEAAVLLAVPLVQWFTSGALQRRP